jgi:hypothetical protein
VAGFPTFNEAVKLGIIGFGILVAKFLRKVEEKPPTNLQTNKNHIIMELIPYNYGTHAMELFPCGT